MHLLKLIILTFFVISSSFCNELNLTLEEKEYLKNNQPIKLHNEMNWPPYNFNENGVPKGFSIDYMNLLAKKVGMEIEYIHNKTWNEFMEMLKNNEIDSIINISKNQERSKYFNFTSVFHTAANAIYVQNGNEHIDTLKKLEGKTIVMPKGFFAQQLLAKHYPNIKQILVKDSLEALRMLSLGKADATVGKKNVLDYIISNRNISGVIATNYVDDNRLVSLVRMATNKDNKHLNSILEKGQKAISDEEILTLKRKWFGSNNLHELNNILTYDEKMYLKNKNTIKMCNIPDLIPIEFYEDNKIKGITIDTLKLVENRLNTKFESILVENFNEAIKNLQNGTCDIIPSVSKSDELVEFSTLTSPVLNYKYAIITQKGKPVVQNIEEVITKTMAKKSTDQLLKLLKSNYPDIQIKETKSDYETLEAVNSGKVYFAIEALPIASYYMSRYALNDIFISRYTNMPFTTSIAVSNSEKNLLNILNKALSTISEDEHTKIFNKWTNMPIKEEFDYSLLWKVFGVVFIIFLILSYRQVILDKHNQKLQLANNEIEKKTKELAKQKELFEKIYSKSADGVLLIKNEAIVDCNEASLNILNIFKDDLLGKKIEDISPKKQFNGLNSKELAKIKIQEALNKGICSFEWIHKTKKQNKSSWIEIVLTSIEIDNEPVIHAVIRDINKRKKMESDLEILTLKLEDKIKQEMKKNQEKTTQLIQQSRLAQMGEMISMIAHQWKQPLTAISATTNNLLLKQLLNNPITKEELKNELELINDYSQHLSSTIDDFRDFFKRDKEKEITTLEDLIGKSINIIKTSFDSKDIILTTKFKYNKKIEIYATEVQQVILNLLKNAEDILIDKNITEKRVKISTYEDNKYAIIEVSDNGGGIEPQILGKIFDPYFTTKKSKEGSGLGLYMSKTIINEHCNGLLKVENAHEGAIFKIYLPKKDFI
jgi:PAS domain S-box-containing protein